MRPDLIRRGSRWLAAFLLALTTAVAWAPAARAQNCQGSGSLPLFPISEFGGDADLAVGEELIMIDARGRAERVLLLVLEDQVERDRPRAGEPQLVDDVGELGPVPRPSSDGGQ